MNDDDLMKQGEALVEAERVRAHELAKWEHERKLAAIANRYWESGAVVIVAFACGAVGIFFGAALAN